MTGPQLPSHRSEEHADWDALAVGWALSALDAEDEARFADHLPGCARCTVTVRESLATVVDLAYATPDEPPPAALRSRLMAAVAAEPRRSGAAEPGQWPLGAAVEEPTDWFAAPPPTDLGDARTPGAPDPGPFPAPAADGAAPPFPRPDRSHRRLTGPADRRSTEWADHRPTGAADHRPTGAADHRPAEWADHRLDRAPEPPVRETPRPRITDLESRRTEAAGPAGRGRHAAPDDPASNVVPLAPRRRRFTVTAAAAAAVALIAGLAVWNVQLRSERDDLQQVVALREAAIAQLTASGPAQVAALTQTGAPSATRQATVVVRGDQVEIIIETLGPNSTSERYWLWTLKCDNGKPSDTRPVQGFTVTQSKFSVRDIGSDPGSASATCFAISREKAAVTPTTPGDVVALGTPIQR